ncbi:MAG TPA: hypothetical protein VGD15_02385 [Kribbella sp.]
MTSRKAARRKAQERTGSPVGKVECEVCGRMTKRLLGVCASVVNPELGTSSTRTTALAYCPVHRDDVVVQFRRQLETEGEVAFFSDDYVELSPGQVHDFLALADRMLADGLTDAAIGQKPMWQPIDPAKVNDAGCPQCGGRVSWGTGPHVDDARRRAHAAAWECLDCHSAGMLLPT